MDLLEHAKIELELLEGNCEDDEALEMQKMVTKDVMQVLDILCSQGHSGFSASYIMNIIRKLWAWEPLGELTGNDDEWRDVDDDKYQNKRCSAIFKDKKTGKAYWLYGYAYSEPNSSAYFTCRESKKSITFPCHTNILKTEYRQLFFPSGIVPIKWANRLHLYKIVGDKG